MDDAVSLLQKGRYRAREAAGETDLAAIHALRGRAFGAVAAGNDPHDVRCSQIMVEDTSDGTLVCAYRLLALDGADLRHSYAAAFYDLTSLESYPGLMLELGRFCVAPERQDPDILRVAWAALTDQVDARDVKLLFGCASFAGVNTAPYSDAFALLRARHLAPARWMPGVRASEVFAFAQNVTHPLETHDALAQMPPLLRTYLLMGGWVSDHAVVDRHMNTLHVFTGLEIGVIPERRKRLLRALVS